MEEVCVGGAGFEVSKADTRSSLSLPLPPACGYDVSSQLLLQRDACLPACHHAPL